MPFWCIVIYINFISICIDINIDLLLCVDIRS